MSKYLLDTNICIFYLKGKSPVSARIDLAELETFSISEITLAELKFGAENSDPSKKEANRRTIHQFASSTKVIPITSALDMFAVEKARLRKSGTPIDDFDLLIGATAVVNGLILVTNNTRHFSRISGIQLEDWSISDEDK